MSRKLNIDEEAWKEAWKTKSGPQMAILFGISVRAVHARNKTLGLHAKAGSEHRTESMKNRGKKVPVGSTSRDGSRIQVKTENGWKPLAIHNWITSTGNEKVPEGCSIGFINNDPTDCSPENLCLIDREESKRLKIESVNRARAIRLERRAQKQKKAEKIAERKSASKAKKMAPKIKQPRKKKTKLTFSVIRSTPKKKEEKKKIIFPDMTKLKAVRIDAKTTIHIRQDEDPQAAIEKYYSSRKTQIA